MIRSFAELFRYTANVWSRVGVNQKIAILLVGVVLVAALFFWGQAAGQPDYGLLFRGLSQQDAAEIVAGLSAQGVAVKVADNGTSVLVPAGDTGRLRLELASQGLPRGKAGFNLFDNQGLLGVSDFVQRVNLIRAIQGELEKTISSLSNVDWARVMIAKPHEELFVNDQKPTTASVVLKMRGGQRPSAGQINGIAHLVAASVEGLAPGNVTITDHQGQPLLKPHDGDDAAVLAAQMEGRQATEQYLASKIIRLLEAVLGPGKAAASVSVELDHTRSDTHEVTYSPQSPSSEYETNSTTVEKNPSGEVAANPNANAGAEPVATTTKESRTEYHPLMPMSETTTAKPGGEIKRITAAVFVEAGTWQTTTDADGKTTRTYTAAADLAQYESIVQEAIGFKQDRDTVVVTDREFWQPQPVEPEPVDIVATLEKDLTPLALKHGPVVLLLVVFVFFARRALKKMENVELPLPRAASVGGADAMTVQHAERASTATSTAEPAAADEADASASQAWNWMQE